MKCKNQRNPLWFGITFILTLLFTVQGWAAKSDIRSMLPLITKVKDQRGRNTCTIFATNAVLESLFIKQGGSDLINLSEEWLQYLAAVTTASGGAKGSMVSINLNNARRWGVAQERAMPFTAGEWQGSETKAIRMCGEESDYSKYLPYVRCLFGKRPPEYISLSEAQLAQSIGGHEFIEAKQSAAEFKEFTQSLRSSVIGENAAKRYLEQGFSLTLEINIYHEAWHTSVATKHGMYRDKSKYRMGEINYPERGTLDRKISPQLADRHAVQIIAYDDDIEMTYTKKMDDGTLKEFTRKGVYIFKNSWGTKEFGRRFSYDGLRMPGLGMILQDHVHDFGKITVIK